MFKTVNLGIAGIFLALLFVLAGCDYSLDVEPEGIVTENDVFDDPSLVRGRLSNLYARLPDYQDLEVTTDMARVDNAIWSGGGTGGVNDWGPIPIDVLSLYGGGNGYGLIRDLNIFLDNIADANFDEGLRSRFEAEGRFLRAYIYFEMVKRMGGVPIITEPLEYDGPSELPSIQRPRNTENEVYQFIEDEIDSIVDNLPQNGTIKRRATRWTALAMKSRAMLYAASIANYTSKTPQVELEGSIVGMRNADPQSYYEKARDAAERIIDNGPYRLYTGNSDLGENFYEAIVNESDNPEVIWVKDYSTNAREDAHFLNFDVMPRSQRDDNIGGASLSPTLDLVEEYEYAEENPYFTSETGDIQACQDPNVTGRCIENGSDYIYFDEIDDPFEGKDPRLWGTIMYPGSTYRGNPLDFQAGILVFESDGGRRFETGPIGSDSDYGGTLTGLDGPSEQTGNTSATGFYLRKFVSTVPGAGNRNQGSGVWWVRYRYAEVLLNAAEAHIELGSAGQAKPYIDAIRERAGLPPLESPPDMEDIRQERRVELAFEGHRYFDMKRWRGAHEVWDGTQQSDPAVADVLFPFRVVVEGDADAEKNGKYVFVKRPSIRQQQPLEFRLANYYSEIPQVALNNNPELIRNPLH